MFDASKNKVKIVSCNHVYKMDQHVRALDAMDAAKLSSVDETFQTKQRVLADTFGSKKTQKRLASRAANEVTVQESTSQVLTHAVGTIQPNEMEAEDDLLEAIHQTVLPRFDETAQSVRDIYTPESIAPAAVLDALAPALKTWRAVVKKGLSGVKKDAKSDTPLSTSAFVQNRLDALASLERSEDRDASLKLLIYLNLLLQFRAGGKNKKKVVAEWDVETIASERVKEQLLADFTARVSMGAEGSRLVFDGQCEQKLLCYIAVTSVLLCNFTLDADQVDAMASDLKMMTSESGNKNRRARSKHHADCIAIAHRRTHSPLSRASPLPLSTACSSTTRRPVAVSARRASTSPRRSACRSCARRSSASKADDGDEIRGGVTRTTTSGPRHHRQCDTRGKDAHQCTMYHSANKMQPSYLPTDCGPSIERGWREQLVTHHWCTCDKSSAIESTGVYYLYISNYHLFSSPALVCVLPPQCLLSGESSQQAKRAPSRPPAGSRHDTDATPDESERTSGTRGEQARVHCPSPPTHSRIGPAAMSRAQVQTRTQAQAQTGRALAATQPIPMSEEHTTRDTSGTASTHHEFATIGVSPSPSRLPAFALGLACSDLGQSTVLSGGELNHYYRLASLDDSYLTAAAARRTAMRDQSQARYKNWGNTLEAQRTRKKLDRQKKLDALEQAQQAIDAEESEYQEAQKRVVLDRANRLLWQDTDKVKNFHGGLLLASVLKEREAQLELAAAKKAQQQLINQTYHDIAEEDRLKALEMSRLEREKRAEQNHAAAAQQLTQLREVRERQEAERAEQVAEGQRIKRIAAEAVKEAEEEDAARKEKMLSYNQEYLRANDEQRALKAQRAAVEALEDSKIAAFAAEKDRLIALRRDHEAAKFASKQARFEKMLRRQYEHLSDIKEAEARRLDSQVKEIEKRTEDREAADAAKRAALKETIRVSRQAQVDRKNAELARTRARDAVLISEWRKRNLEMADAEHEEERATLESALRLQQTLREQMAAKESRVRAEVDKEYEEAQMMREAREREDAVFQAYCTQQLGDLQIKGKSTIPLQLVLHNERMRTQRPGNFMMATNFR